jgi:predicted O-methyltransferase YrrM
VPQMEVVALSLEYLEWLMWDTAAAGRYFDYGCDRTELTYLAKLASLPGIRVIGETGFNAGFSSCTFLQAHPDSLVYSFDLAEFEYTGPAKQHIDENFPGRHTLIVGDSRRTIPEFHRRNPQLKFDLIFIDGGHSYEIARADVRNMRALATRDTILVIDDITPWKPTGVGPTRVWLEALEEGSVSQSELIKEGEPVTTIEPPGNRLWAVGRYTF